MRVSRLASALLVWVALVLAPVAALAQGAVPAARVPTRPANDNSLLPANTAYVDASAQVLLNAIGTKAPRESPTFSGIVTAPTIVLTGPGSTGDASALSVNVPDTSILATLAEWLGLTPRQATSIATLRTISAGKIGDGTALVLAGYYAPGDGGGGTLVWSRSSTASEDGCTVFKPTAIPGVSAGRWLRGGDSSGPINVRTCGASPGVADSGPAINAAILAAEARLDTRGYWGPAGTGGVYTPAGLYTVSGIDLHRGIPFVGDGPAATKFVLMAGSNRSVITSSAAPQADPAPWSPYGQATLRGFSIDGNASAQSGTSHGIEFKDAPYTISARYATAARIENVDVNGTAGAGVYAGKNRNFGFMSKVIIQYANNYGVNFNGAYDWSIADSSIGVSKVAGINLYYSGAVTITNTAIYGNIGPGIQVQEGFGSYLWVTGGAIEGNTTHGLAVIPPAGSTNGVIGLANVHLINNSAGADNTSSHIYVRNFAKLSLSNVVARVHPSTNPGAKYIVDNDATAPVMVSNLMYDSTGSEVPYKTAPFATPGSIVGATNPMGGTFGLTVPFSAPSISSGPATFTGPAYTTSLQTLGLAANPWGTVFARGFMARAGNGVDLVTDFDGSSGRAQMQVYSGGTASAVGTSFYDFLLQPKGGNVGIGTGAPGAKLDVAGTMRGQMLVLSAAPTVTNIPPSYWTVVKRTDDASVKICANDNGTIKCAAMQ